MKEVPEFRIEDIQRITLNGVKYKMFKAYKKIGNDWIFIGNYTATPKVKNQYLSNTLNYA